MPKQKLTKTFIDSVQATDKTQNFWDTEVPSFGIRVFPSGTRKYVIKYRSGKHGTGNQRWFTIGAHGVFTPDQARKIARSLFVDISNGIDPQENKNKARKASTMAELWARYTDEHLPQKKSKSQQEDIRLWQNHLEKPIGNTKAEHLSRNELQQIHSSLRNTPYQANRVLALASKLCNLAEQWGIRSDHSNPARHITKFKEKPRERYLDANELQRLGKTLNSGHHEFFVCQGLKLLLFTGARFTEIFHAKWEWVDWQNKSINLPDSKTGPKQVLLSDAAMDVLNETKSNPDSQNSPFIIQGRKIDKPMSQPRKQWLRICQDAKIENCRIHDFRHTFASIGVGEGLTLSIVGALMGHSQAQTTQRYAHLNTSPALTASNLIGNSIAALWQHTDENSDNNA